MSTEAKPLYFPSADQTLFGWLHRARGFATSDVGVVICNPFGYEAVCAHRGIRAFADLCTNAGVPALRFDYSGTGDSSGSTLTRADQISAWCADIEAAIDALKSTAGVERICLLGVRLGAMLAGVVAARRNVDFLIAIDPVTNGRRYVRELRALQATANAQSDSAAASTPASGSGETATPASGALSSNAEGLDVTGFMLSQASVEHLSRLDLAKMKAAPSIAALILDREGLPTAGTWAGSLESAAIDLQYASIQGFSDMLSTPHTAVVPSGAIEAMNHWIARLCSDKSPVDRSCILKRLPKGARMQLRGDQGTELTERAVFIDANHSLFAIVTESRGRSIGPDTSGYAVVLLNTGATNHTGPSRMYVDLARDWAARGYVVLRLDLAGIGDSDTAPGQDSNQVYPPGAIYDISVAIEFLRRRRGIRNVTLAGVCAGAYHALQSAIAGLPVSTVLLINPLTFYWKQGTQLSDLQISEVVRNPGVYSGNVRSVRHWMKLFRGQVNLRRIAMVFIGRAWLAIDAALREVCRRLNITMRNDLGRDLQDVAARGIRIVFLFARTDAGHELLKIQGGSVLSRLGQLCRIHLIDNADHIFTQRPARTQLMQLLSTELPQ